MKALAVVLAVSVAGCSWVGVKRVPSKWTPDQELKCTSSRVAPWADLVPLAVTVVVFAAIANGCDPDTPIEEKGSCGALALPILMALPSLLFATSSVTGFVRTGSCRKAKRERKAWQRSQAQ